MKRILRIPVKDLFSDPMELENQNSSPWNIFRNLFELKKCKYIDYTNAEEFAKKSIAVPEAKDEIG